MRIEDAFDLTQGLGEVSGAQRIRAAYPNASEQDAADALHWTDWSAAPAAWKREAEEAFARGDWARVLYEAQATSDYKEDMRVDP